MSRFDADTPAERRALVADAVRAHRERASPFLTVEAGRAVGATARTDAATDGDDGGDGPGGGSRGDPEGAHGADASGDGSDPDPVRPWVQYDVAEGLANLDCTDDELDALESVLGAYPEFRIAELNRPEEAEGTNVRVRARTDPDRLAAFVEDVFREVYGYPEGYRLWVAEV